MTSLSKAQQFTFEAYVSFCQRVPTGKIDLIKIRKFIRECEAVCFMSISFLFSQSNASVPRLSNEVVDEIFERSLESGNRKLNFEQFEKAAIMMACLSFPGVHGAEAYVKWIDEVLRQVVSIKSPHFMDTSVERAALIADAILEKKNACTFHPLMEKVSEPPISMRRSKSEERVGPISTERMSGSLDSATFNKLVKEVTKGMQSKLRKEAARLDDSPVRQVSETSKGPKESPISLESFSEAKSQVFPKRLPIRPCSAAAKSVVKSSNSNEIGPIPHDDAHERSLKFQEVLLHEFGDLDFAFEYLDSVTGARTKQISSTKFRYGWKALGMTGDVKQVFGHIDLKGDGVITLDELKGWKEFREKLLRKKTISN